MSETSLMVQWLRFHAATAGGEGSIPGQGSSARHTVWQKKKIFKTKCGNKSLV